MSDIDASLRYLCRPTRRTDPPPGCRQGKRLGGQDRGKALPAIVTGWLLILFALVLVLAYGGPVAGLGVLGDSAS
ncbi:hypothetical protein [Streptomyces sp. S063]|uniref:hypothetical protein n=1 Tax=Streptomyces sp. S063 TaxID=2005885 RepID=UPI0010085E68|nr:hypothetical protein [Streptomyces sp. S063]